MRLTVAVVLFLLFAPSAHAQTDCPPLLPEAACAPVRSPAATEAAITAYEGSWLHRTLAYQYRLGSRLPLVNAPLIGTHNSFNTLTESPTLSGTDANQRLSMRDQLRIDVRSLEIDVHNIGGRPVVCHGRGADEQHAGCTNERPFADRLAEIRAWLKAHPREVILLYLEDHLEGAYDAGAEVLAEELGPELYRPPPGECAPMPLRLTRKAIRRAGKQVLAISGCGEGSAWAGLIFDDEARSRFEGGGDDFEPYPECDYSDHFQRFFEDSTALSAGVDTIGGATPGPGLTPERTREMTRCGVDLFGFDQLQPDDGRLAATVWSWARDEPSGRGCAVQSGRWRIVPCSRKRAFACRRPGGRLTIRKQRAPWGRKPRGCGRVLPRSGYQAQRLRDAMRRAGVRSVWLRSRS